MKTQRWSQIYAYYLTRVQMEEALGNETRRGLEVIQSDETRTGARCFVEGYGWHGSMDDI